MDSHLTAKWRMVQATKQRRLRGFRGFVYTLPLNLNQGQTLSQLYNHPSFATTEPGKLHGYLHTKPTGSVNYPWARNLSAAGKLGGCDMRKATKPWYRAFNDTWYTQKDGVKIPLAKGKANEKAALAAFYKVMAGDKPTVGHTTTVEVLFDLFLNHSQKHNKPETYQWYRHFLSDFAYHHGKHTVSALKPYHVNTWIAAHHAWQDNTRRSAITIVKRALNWAVDEGYIPENPIKRMKKPEGRARQRFLTSEERQAIRDNYLEGDPWLDFLTALEESGARPGEVATVTAAHVNFADATWRFSVGEHKTGRKTKKPRTIILTPKLLALTQRLMQLHPTGPLFRNRDGRPWTKYAIRCRFQRVRKKLNLGNDVCAYLYRHSYVTDALTNGVPIASVAELVGHVSTEMVSKHYSKLGEQLGHLHQMALKATNGKEKNDVL